MTKKFVIALAIVVLAICLISGGCLAPPEKSGALPSWKDLIKMAPELEPSKVTGDKESKSQNPSGPAKTGEARLESTDVELYFLAADGQSLVLEKRSIEKTEGIARRTLEELIKGPQSNGDKKVFPQNARLLDINIKPDGLCIVDFSAEVRKVSQAKEEKILVDAVAATLGQFPTVKEVSFMVNGEKVDSLAGAVDLSRPVIAEPKV